MHVVTHMYTYMYICMIDGYMVLISMNVMFHDHFIVYRLSYTQLFDNFMAFSWDLSSPPTNCKFSWTVHDSFFSMKFCYIHGILHG